MKEPSKAKLTEFIKSSYGPGRKVTAADVALHQSIIRRERLEVKDLVTFVKAIEPKAVLRSEEGYEVEIGKRFAPRGGPQIVSSLELLLSKSLLKPTSIFRLQLTYLWLHPFTEGNGRSGRAIWLWHRVRHGGFMEDFYLDFFYESCRLNDNYMERLQQLGKIEQALTGGGKNDEADA